MPPLPPPIWRRTPRPRSGVEVLLGSPLLPLLRAATDVNIVVDDFVLAIAGGVRRTESEDGGRVAEDRAVEDDMVAEGRVVEVGLGRIDSGGLVPSPF